MKKYEYKLEERSKLRPEQIKNLNMKARKFVGGNMLGSGQTEFVWDLLRLLDALGVLRSGIIDE